MYRVCGRGVVGVAAVAAAAAVVAVADAAVVGGLAGVVEVEWVLDGAYCIVTGLPLCRGVQLVGGVAAWAVGVLVGV